MQSDSTNVDIPEVQSFSTSSSSDVQSETDFSDNTENPVNCLSLTVRKDYSLSVVKHVLVRTWKTTWRVALSIFLLNFLSFFFYYILLEYLKIITLFKYSNFLYRKFQYTFILI